MNDNLKGLMTLAKEHSLLRAQFEQSVRDHVNQTYHLSDDEFWPILEALSEAMIAARGRSDMSDSKRVIEEFVRARLFDKGGSAKLATWERLASFARTYGHHKGLVYKVVSRFDDLDMGDDSLGDFCDSFVLAGRAKFGLLVDGTLATMKQVSVCLLRTRERFIMRGENYIEMFLVDALISKTPSVARDVLREDDPPLKKCQTPVVGFDMDLQSILDALAPIMGSGQPAGGNVTLTLTREQYVEACNVVAMLQLADLVNYKKAQDAYPRLLQALNLVLAIADNPDANPGEKISLATKTRAQLDSALKFAEK